MSFYQINSGQLRSKKDELSALCRRFIQEKENLCAVELALGSMWEGAANEQFHAAFMKNAGQMDSFAQLVGRYIGVIGRIADRYDTAEQKNLGRTI
jgi:WXG100 family type VII secretion target